MVDFDVDRATILRMLVGSQAYGLSVGASSDRDEKGICVEPMAGLVGFHEFEQWEHRDAASREGGKHNSKSQPGDLDVTIYGLRKFLRLALKGNPTIVEMLFIKEHLVCTPLGAELQALTPYIVSKQAGRAYLGYMQAQKHRLLGERGGKDVNRPELVEAFGYDTKYAMHALRLAMQGIDLLTRGYLTLPLGNEDRDCLLGVRLGHYTLKEVTDDLEHYEGVLKDRLKTSFLPDHPNEAYVERWMLDVYTKEWQQW